MKINRAGTILLGAVTCLPLVGWIILIVYMKPRLLSFGRPGGLTEGQFFRSFNLAYIASIALIALMFALVAMYLWLLHKTTRVPPREKPLWSLLLLGGNCLVMPIFWYLVLWRQGGYEQAPRQAGRS
jgi:hypothetical protein